MTTVLDPELESFLQSSIRVGSSRTPRESNWAHVADHPRHSEAMHAIELTKQCYRKARALRVKVEDVTKQLGRVTIGPKIYRVYAKSEIREREIDVIIEQASALDHRLDELLAEHKIPFDRRDKTPSRIDHSGHNHPMTWQGRKECRDRMLGR